MTEPIFDPAVVASFGALEGDEGLDPTAAILALFRRETEARMVRLHAAIDGREAAAVVREAHARRGGAGIVGAVRLSSSAQALERIASGEAVWPDVEQAWRDVSAASTATLAALG